MSDQSIASRAGRVLASIAVTGSLLLAACGGDDNPAASPAASPAGESTVAGVAAERLEVTRVKAARPPIANLVAELRKGDVSAAKAAFAPYNGVFNGIEVYIQVRARDLYLDLENNWEAKITEALNAAQPNAAEILPLAEAMLARYDEAIALSQNGPAISPLFDDVADVRMARIPLREVRPALDAANLTRARESFSAFNKAWPTASALIKLRSATAAEEVAQAIARVETAWQKPQPAAAELAPLVATVTSRFNYGLSLVNAAARGADLTKTTYAPDDAKAAAALRAIEVQLTASLASWKGGNFADAGSKATQASGPMLGESTVAARLKAKALDTNLKTALDAYASMSGAAGDAAKVSAANQAAVEALEVAIQTLVGQFWTDPQLQATLGGKAAAAPSGAKVSANKASRSELQRAFEAAGIPNAARLAGEVEEYRPYPAYDTNMGKLRQELAKYNIPINVVDQVVATLALD